MSALLVFIHQIQATLTTLLLAYPVWAGVLLAGVVMLESIPLLGSLVPGAALLTIAGGLVAAGKLGFWPALLGSLAGAILGDALTYHLGYRWRHSIWHWRIWRRHQAALTRTRHWFEKYGTGALILGRWVPGVRAFIAIIAGASGLGPTRFYAANVIGALIWVPAHLLVGQFALRIFI